ncbi:hypothetical protein PCANC_00426 [Puccinia coronata f. sp. avenae]|uniref:Uncharacterized protein n=1 Tax=Puccinia coronata f. sp. avenae TaxID=200324 RepID=A0A2N5W951_9BASI|nr:hypothetical protein PCANC_00426 [Puccinia coronata f. sp. avenae]
MGFPFNWPCLCWPSQRKHTQQQDEQQSIHAQPEPEADERTPLIANPPPVTPSPSLPIIDTAQQQADEAAANKIVSQTVKCLVDVYSQAPFPHLKIRGTVPTSDLISDLAQTPAGSSTAWRAYDPPHAPPVDSKVPRYQLSASSDYQSTSTHHGQQAAAQKRSFHSLKTIINHQDRFDSDERDTRLSASLIEQQPDPLTRLSSSATLPESTHTSTQSSEHQPHSRRNSLAPTSCSTQFDTIRTFQTARDDPHLAHDDDDNDDDSQEVTLTSDFPIGNLDTQNQPSPQTTSKPDFVTHLWDQPPEQPTPTPPEDSPEHDSDRTSCHTAEPDHLTDDPKKLAEMISNGFHLTTTGPIIAEL